MRIPFFYCLLYLTIGLPLQLWSKHATVELRFSQADWAPKTKSLAFDMSLRALDKPFYLAFSDLVFVLPKTGLDVASLTFTYQPGTTQLFNLGGDLLDYPGIRTKLKQSQDSVYFIVQVMPNQFTDLSDFFDQSAYISQTAGENRVGRFVITGMTRLPELIKPNFASKGPSSLILAFDPNDQLRAVELDEKGTAVSPLTDPLKYFELSGDSVEIHFSWKWQVPKQAWELWGSTDRKAWVLLKSGQGGEGVNLVLNPNPDNIQPSFNYFRISHKLASGGQQQILRISPIAEVISSR